MLYSLTFPDTIYQRLVQHLFSFPNVESAAYLLCNLSTTETEKRLLVSELIVVTADEVESSTATEIVIKQHSYLRAIQKADRDNKSFFLVHSHPSEFPDHSPKDDIEERDLFRTAYVRIHNEEAVHGSIVFCNPNNPVGRVWLEDGSIETIERIRVIGNRISFYDKDKSSHINIASFNRQILAFGEDVQNLLGRLKVGVVGLGGTGSAVVEQLARLGVGRLVVCDPQSFDPTNVNRVFGSSVDDEEEYKTNIAKRNVESIGLGTIVDPIIGDIAYETIVAQLKQCDIIFGCTDDESGRAILTRLAAYYFIPVFDMGVEIDSAEGFIKSVRGRVTTLLPESPCLFCRGIITSDVILAETLHKMNPTEYEERLREGYIPELPGNTPSIIMFTSGVAGTAISEMLHRITGYMGADRNSTEVILRFDESKISTNSRKRREGCWCGNVDYWGKGDVDPFLGLTWPRKAQS